MLTDDDLVFVDAVPCDYAAVNELFRWSFKPLPDFDQANQGPHISEPQEWPDEGESDEQC